MTDIAKLSIEVDSSGLTQGTTALTNFQKVGDQTEASIRNNTNGMVQGFRTVRAPIESFKQSVVAAQPQMKGFGNNARQMSMQLSQVAQQGSVTGNFLQALAIQLPDLALGFGTLGILIGAAAGALAVFFINSAKKAEQASDDLKESIDGLVGSYEDLGHAQRELLRFQIAEETKNLTKENTLLASETKLLVTQYDSLTRSYERGSIGVVEYNEKTAAITNTLRENKAAIEANNQTIKDRNDVLNESVRKEEELEEAIKRSDEARNAIGSREDERLASQLAQQESLTASLRTQTEKIRDAAEEEKAILANSYSENIIDLQEYREARSRIDSKFSAASIALAERDQAQRNQILSAGQQAGLGIIGAQMGQMAALFKEGGKASFEEYKIFATGQAIISAALAVNNALAVPIIGPALAVTAGVLGAAQVAVIQNQQYQGARAMGGQVEAGGRFLVGENGPEVLQLGSQGGAITPNHALGAGGGANVTMVMNVQAGVTKAEVLSIQPLMIRGAINAVKAEMNKGGTMSQAIKRRA